MTWDAIYRDFPEFRSQGSFAPENINDPINAITLKASIRHEFGLFLISLEATVSFLIWVPRCQMIICLQDVVNTYRIMTYPDLPDSEKMMIKSSAPSPCFLKVHAAIARILHMTAMGETIESILGERKDIGCLANDGSSNAQQLLLAF